MLSSGKRSSTWHSGSKQKNLGQTSRLPSLPSSSMLGQIQKIIDMLIDLHVCTMDNGQMKSMLLTYACRDEKLIIK